MEDAQPTRYGLVAGWSLLLHLLILLFLVATLRRQPPEGGFPVPAIALHRVGPAVPSAPAHASAPVAAAKAAAAPAPAPAPEPQPQPALPPPALAEVEMPPPPPVPPAPAGGAPTQEKAEETGAPASVSASSAAPAPRSGEDAPGSLSLYGLEGSGRRIALLFDVSDSVFLRTPGLFDALYAEALARIDALPPGVLFDLIVFKNGSLAWKAAPVPATAANRTEARRWMEKIARQGAHFSVRGGTPGIPLVEGGGTRGDTALRQALGLTPDWIVVLTDGQWQATRPGALPAPIDAAALVDDLRAKCGDGALPRIDVLLLTSPKTKASDGETVRALSEASGGSLVSVDNEVVRGK